MGRTTTARYRALGDELRKRRESAGLTRAQLSKRTDFSEARIFRIETGQAGTSAVDAVHYLGQCGLYPPQVIDLIAEFSDAENRQDYWLTSSGQWLDEWVCSLILHESTASKSVSYEPHVIPGLLQTESYAREMIRHYDARTDEDLETYVRARRERQRILRRLRPARFTFYIHENALRLPVDGPAVMQEQLLSLMFVDGLPHVSVRVVPTTTTFGGAFRLFEFADHKPLVYLTAHVAGLFVEDRKYVEQFRALIPLLADAALDEGQSRRLIADLADEYDRGSAGDRVEEEQL
jgi:transcriptional regulator with XRE-family HTH domain